MRWKENDKDCQRYFGHGEKAAAKLFQQGKQIEIGNHGVRHGSISDSERAALITFRTAVSSMPEPRPTLLDCVNLFLAGIVNQLEPVTVAALVEKRVAAAEAKRVHPRTVRDLVGADGTGGRLGAFVKAFPDRMAAGISAEEIEVWVNGQCATSANRREMLVRLRGLFAYGVKRGFLTKNPVSRLELPRPNAARATILTVKQARSLLAHCPASVLPAVAVQLFAGLRHAEAERLLWQDIDFENNSLRAVQRKGNGLRREKSRHVPMQPALRAWLAPHRQHVGPVFPVANSGPRKGSLSPQTYRKGFERARTDAGFETWDENTLRHCFGSYRLAVLNDVARVSAEMGHATTRTTIEHYLNAVRAKDAAAFWAIKPDRAGAKTKIVPMRKTA